MSHQQTGSIGITSSTHDSISRDDTIYLDISINEKDQLYKWLAAPNCSINYSTALSRRVDGTGQWIFKAAMYLRWKKEGNFLWIQGKAGSGKTILVASVIENLLLSHSGIVAYHYFNFCDNSGDKRSYQGMLLNLLLQLGFQDHKIHPALKSLYELSQSGILNFKPTSHKLADVLITIIRDLVVKRHWIYIIIDALDECKESLLVMKFLSKLTGFHKVGILVSSRNHSETTLKCLTISLNSHRMVNKDIDTVVENWAKALFKMPVFEAKVKKLLLQKVDEGFCYINCQMHSLTERHIPRNVLNALEKSPSDLHQIYTEAIQKCKSDEDSSTEAHYLLLWLLYSFEPLQLGQVAVIVSMDLNSLTVNTASLSGGLERIISPMLVTVDAQNVVQFAHASVKEFLLESQNNHQMEELLEVNARFAHNIMAQMCLIYLLQHTNYENSFSESRGSKGNLGMFKHYATQYWAEHSKYNENANTPDEKTLKLTQNFLYHGAKQLINWQKSYYYIGNKFPTESQIFSNCIPLHIMAFFGLRNSAQRLITTNTASDIDSQGEMLGTAFQTAAFGGHNEIIQLLLKHNADINKKGGYFGTALHAAISGGYKKITYLLLKYNADVNAEGGYYGTAIQTAASEGDLDIIQVLLNHNANLNAQGGYYGTALQAASFNGYKDIVELLLNFGAEVNVQGGRYGNALQAAVAENHQDVIKILLKHNADPNAQGGYYGTALQAAAFWGYKDTIELLLESGVDVNIQGGEYGNALQAAVTKNYKSIIQLLLKNGADIVAQGGYYGTALHAAAFLGSKEILELFLGHGIDVNAQGGEYGTALQAAVAQGHKSITELLLKHGADTNAAGEHGTAWQIAEDNNQEDIVELLLEYGTEINA
ncbi:ankyrin repeat-containing domain protein [Lentinula raphanica]|nr:ankyrin repeat-containing domain protein [Lentinula raphanica]